MSKKEYIEREAALEAAVFSVIAQTHPFEEALVGVIRKNIAQIPIENVLVPPVAVGGVVYYPMVFDPEEGVENYVCEERVHGIAFLEDGTWLVRLFDGTWGPVGEDFFVTREEAEKRLADAK